MLLGLLATTMLMRASQNMAQTTFPLLGGDLLHLPASEVGAIAAASGGAAVVTMVALASRIPVHRGPAALVASLVVLAAAFPVIAVSGNGAVLTVGALLLGSGGGLAFPTLITAVGGTASQSARDRPIALLGVALSASLAIGPFVESGILAATGDALRPAFLWFTLAPLAAMGLTLVVYRGTQASRDSGASALRTAPERATVLDARPRRQTATQTDRLSFLGALRDRSFQVALMGQLLYAAPFSALIVFGALMARHVYGLSAGQVQLAFGVFFLTSFLVRAGIAWRSPIAHKLAGFQVSAALTLAGLLVVGWGHGELALLTAMVLLGIPHGLTFPLAMAIVAEDRSAAHLGAVNAHLTASIQAVNLVLPLALGLGVDALGFRAVYLLLAAPVSAAALALLKLWRGQPGS